MTATAGPLSIQISRADVADEPALRRLAEQLPANVNPHHLAPALIGVVAKAARAHGVEELHLRVIAHGPMPVHFATAFRHDGMMVAGPVFISVLHAVGMALPEHARSAAWAAPLREIRTTLPGPARQALIEHYLGAYLTNPEADLTVITVPHREAAERETSPTHRAFARVGAGPVVAIGSWDGYTFGPAIGDPLLLGRLRLLRSAWSATSTSRYMHKITAADTTIPGHAEDELRRLATAVDSIRVCWRASL